MRLTPQAIMALNACQRQAALDHIEALEEAIAENRILCILHITRDHVTLKIIESNWPPARLH